MEKKCPYFAEDLLESMRRDKKYSDFVLKVGGEDIPVHRSVLSTASPYFEAMLSSDTIEKKNGGAEICDLDPDAVRTCIHFIYSGKAKLSLENPELLIQASDLMQISQLKKMYFEFLTDNMTVETCLLYIRLASKYHVEVISETLGEYMMYNIEKIFNSERLSKLDEQELFEALDLLPANLPNREIRKWRAIETWVKMDVENRKEKFLNLFKVLLLDKIPLEYLMKDVLFSDLVKCSEECRSAIMTSFLSENQRPSLYDVHEPVAATDSLLASNNKPTHIVTRNRNSPWLHIMDLATYNWSVYARLPPDLRGLPIVAVMGRIYIRTKNGNLFSYSDGKWKKICTLNEELHNCHWLGFGNCIWFIEHNCILKYNPATNIWAKLHVNPDLNSVSTCAVSKDRIMLMGTKKTTKTINVVRVFNFTFHEWDKISATTATISGACFVNDTCITWNTESNNLKKYDPNIDEWVTLQAMNGQGNLAGIRQIIASDGHFYLVGKDKGAVCNCASFKTSNFFNVPTKFSDFCLI